MGHDAIANHHGLVTRINTHMNMEAERNETSSHFLKEVDQTLIPVVGSHYLVMPLGKRMSRTSPQSQSQMIRGLFKTGNFISEVGVGFGNRPTDL